MRHFAPAKVNLALHVTGRRDDGYHLLDSLVVFVDVGDWVTLNPAPAISLRVTGPRASGVPGDARNLVWRAADWAGQTAAITLEKHLPHAGGIGGGSSDAAAVLRALGVDATGAEAIGADLPVCIRARATRMRGIGDVLEDVPDLPALWAVLVNPGVDVPTGEVFRRLQRVDNSPMPDPAWGTDFFGWLGATRNDLQDAAVSYAPVIGEVLAGLSMQSECRFARMSGSGATCFGLFDTVEAAKAAQATLPQEWWSVAAKVLP